MTKTTKTFRQQVEALTVRIAKLVAERAALAVKAETELDFSRIEQGTTVTFVYGRADTRKNFTGVVLGRKSQAKGADLLKIQAGEGFDASIYTVLITSVVSVGPVEQAEAPAAE